MALGLLNVPILSPDQADPFGHGLAQGVLARLNAAKASNQEAQNPYAGQKALADLLNQQNINKYYGPNIQSEMNLRGAQGNYANSEAGINNYKLGHPGLLQPEQVQLMQIYKQMQDAAEQGNNQPSAPQMPNVNAPSPQLNLQSQPMNPMAASVNNVLNGQQSMQNANQMPNIPNMPQSQSGAQMIPGTNIRTTGDATADQMLLKQIGYTPSQQYQQKMAQAFDWVHSTADAKNDTYALLRGADIDPNEAQHDLSSGKTVDQIMQDHGYKAGDYKYITPNYLATTANRTTLNSRRAALASADILDKYVKEGLAPFSRQYAGYSPEQVLKAATNKDPEQQARYLSALMLSPDLNNNRIAIGGGRVGQAALEHMENTSLTNGKVYRGLVSTPVFNRAQELTKQALHETMDAASKAWKTNGKEDAKISGNSSQTKPTISKDDINEENIAHTAKVRGMTVDQVKQKLREKGRL